MNIAIYTLTRDRLQYTKDCFDHLSMERWATDFAHFIFDNGSEDGTATWLERYARNRRLDSATSRLVNHTNIHAHPINEGISVGSNACLNAIFDHEKESGEKYDLIVKMDNDCMIKSNKFENRATVCIEGHMHVIHGPFILAEFSRIYSECKEAERWVLSPRVEGINKQPRRVRQHTLAGHEIGVTAIVGGLFHVVPAPIYREFMAAGGYDETLPKAALQDDQFCEWLRANKYNKGYVEDLVVEHYHGTTKQCEEMPAYFERKWKEEKERP